MYPIFGLILLIAREGSAHTLRGLRADAHYEQMHTLVLDSQWHNGAPKMNFLISAEHLKTIGVQLTELSNLGSFFMSIRCSISILQDVFLTLDN